MKLNRNITHHTDRNTVQQFGQAKLVQHRNGRHELIGGTAADRAAAFEWVSLFAHEIVISTAQTRPVVNCRIRRTFGLRHGC